MAFKFEEDFPLNFECAKSDELFQCPICLEFLSVPVVMKCSHSFCSLCIRKYLSKMSECPVCYRLFRANVDSGPTSTKTLASAVRTGKEDPFHLPGTVACSPGCDDGSKKAVKPRIKVVCPVCYASVPERSINKHLDTCLTSSARRSSLRSAGDWRLPVRKLVYSQLSDEELRRKLQRWGLSPRGLRIDLIRRHQEFVDRYWDLSFRYLTLGPVVIPRSSDTDYCEDFYACDFPEVFDYRDEPNCRSIADFFGSSPDLEDAERTSVRTRSSAAMEDDSHSDIIPRKRTRTR